MALTASNNESFSNPISNTNRSPVQGDMMASPTSLGGFEVVTPVLSTAEVLIDIDPKLTNESTPEARTKNKADTAKATPSKKPTEVGLIEEAIEMKESAEKGNVEEAITEQAPDSLAEPRAIKVNDEWYVEVPHETHSEHCILIDGTCYVQESAPKMHMTAFDLLQSADFDEDKDISQNEISHASRFVRGQPIMLYIGTHSYSVHVSTLNKSFVLASMRLDKAEDGTYSINLPEEDPIQFERLLTYMYQGTWEPEKCEGDCAPCWGVAQGQVCGYWTNKKYMQLYAIASKYGIHGLAEKVAAKLDLEENVFSFCEAFETAYKMCPGNHDIRSLFRKNLVPVFENTLRMSPEMPNFDPWGNSNNSMGLASELAQLALWKGDFAVDLMQAFATAQESAYRAKIRANQQDAGDHDHWGCETVEGGNDWAPANNEGYHETEQDAGGRFSTSPVVNDRRRCVETPAPVPATLPIREDMKDIQGRVRNLEDMVSRLQFIAETSVQTQQPAFQQPPNGSAPGYIAPGWGPGPSVPAKVSWPSGWD